jgi:hypothetical protein
VDVDPAELPPDPDLDEALELREATGQLWISGRNPETGERCRDRISREDAAAALADARRLREGDDADA